MFESSFSYYRRDYSSTRSAPRPSHLPLMVWCQHHHRSPADVNAHRKALNDFFATLKIATRAGFTYTNKQPCDFASSQEFIFSKLRIWRCFANIKPSQKFSNLKYLPITESLQTRAHTCFFSFFSIIHHRVSDGDIR